MDVEPQGLQGSVTDEVSLCAQASGLDRQRVAQLSEFGRERGESLIESLVNRGGIGEEKLLARLAEALGLRFVPRSIGDVPQEILGKVPPSLAVRYEVMPLEQANGRLTVACWNPFDWHRWDELAFLVDLPLERALCPRSAIREMVRASYGLGAGTVEHLASVQVEDDAEAGRPGSVDISSDEQAANEPTVVNLVNQVLAEAIRANATDVHFEPYEAACRIRYRVDGMLEDVPVPTNLWVLRRAVISRIKIMSRLDITQKRLPQDGRAEVSLEGQKCDLRVSVLPGIHGEAVVVRIQNRQNVSLDLASLGFDTQEQERIRSLIGRPHGLILVTGPTGSGKTTTIYTCLKMVCQPERKIITIEDPVEYWMDDMLQMQVHREIGFTFATALRSMLRHDPDIMLVGEIRDRETAEIAIRSALTGHMVFATLHTNDAAGAVTRLCDIGIEPFLVASSLHGVLAQRLVRRVCTSCRREERDIPFADMEDAFGAGAVASGRTLFKGAGCEKCRFTGYRGRTVVAEILTVSPAIRQMIQRSELADRIRDHACREGMRPLWDSAMNKVLGGETSVEELLRVTQKEM
jgi:type II secretory ATPase GspE/PulE/Tfp pilus assembly ATPase PilB-like protein